MEQSRWSRCGRHGALGPLADAEALRPNSEGASPAIPCLVTLHRAGLGAGYQATVCDPASVAKAVQISSWESFGLNLLYSQTADCTSGMPLGYTGSGVLRDFRVSSFHKAKERYAISRSKAISATTATLVPEFDIAFEITGWNSAAQTAYHEQWPNPEFDWVEVFRRHNDPDRLDISIWVGERLCGLALGITTANALNLMFLEGDSREDCPLTGLRIPIFLDIATNYTQDRGKSELRVWPLNDTLAELYRDTYGFSLVTTGPNTPYWRKGV